ncbi:MAG TPA: DNA polymerase Y family protein, partial [Planctomycetota bacterium]|nr:DNA polymerase Y family protein [Planctomycetota bacterium]
FAGGGGSASHALLVDATGLDHIHGGETQLLERATGELREFGYEVRGAIADTLVGALALARFAPGIAREGQTREALRLLPPRALGLDERALERLSAVGVESIEQLLRLPRTSLAPRFGEAVLDLIDRATGEKPDVLVAATFPETVTERLDLEGGTDSQEALAKALEILAARVLERLSASALGARTVELVFNRTEGPADRFEVHLASPVSGLEALLGVLRERLERLDLARPVEAVFLRVPETARLDLIQADLFSTRERPVEEDLACLLARLEGQLGVRGVARAELVPDHRPERAYVYTPASGPSGGNKDEPPGRRPTRLLRSPWPIDVATTEDGEPVRFCQKGLTHPVQRAVGPERIESGFWEGKEVRRDYWIVADEAWRELWIYRDLDQDRWFLHGIFD